MKDQKVTPVAAKPVEAAKPTVAINSAAAAPKSATPVPSSATAEPAKASAPAAPKIEIARSEAANVDVAKAEITKAQVTKVEAVKVETQKPAPAAAAPASEKKAVDTPAAKALVKAVDAAPAKVEAKPAPANKVAAKAIQKPAAKVEAKPTAKAAPKIAPKAASAPVAATAKPAVAKPSVTKPATEKKKVAKSVRPALEDIIPEAPASAFSFPPAFNEKSLPRPETIAAPFATMMGIGADTARKTLEHAQESNESMRQACLESANAASRGIVALNTQMLDLVRAQTDATMDLWRSALTAPSLSEAVKIQTSGARQAYETTAAHLKIIAETTTRVVGETTKPIQTALNDRSR